MPPAPLPPPWEPFCPQTGMAHAEHLSAYTFCGQCGKRNPHPVTGGRPFQRESHALRGESHSAVASLPTSSPSKESDTTPRPRHYGLGAQPSEIHRSSTASSSYSLTSFNSLGRGVAEAARASASRRINQDDPPRPNAGSVSLSQRTPKVAREKEKPVILQISVYTITARNVRGGTVYSEPLQHGKQWRDTFLESEFNAHLPENEMDRAEFLLCWCIDRSPYPGIDRLEGLRFFVTGFDDVDNTPLLMSKRPFESDSLAAMIAPFTRRGTRYDPEHVVKICFEQTLRRGSTVLRTPRADRAKARASDSTPLRSIKKEKPYTWTLRTVDPSKPPDYIDMSHPSPIQEERAASLSSDIESPTMLPNKPSPASIASIGHISVQSSIEQDNTEDGSEATSKLNEDQEGPRKKQRTQRTSIPSSDRVLRGQSKSVVDQ